MSHETLATGVCSNVAHQTAPDDWIDLELGEAYYGGQKALEDQLANEIIVVIKGIH